MNKRSKTAMHAHHGNLGSCSQCAPRETQAALRPVTGMDSVPLDRRIVLVTVMPCCTMVCF